MSKRLDHSPYNSVGKTILMRHVTGVKTQMCTISCCLFGCTFLLSADHNTVMHGNIWTYLRQLRYVVLAALIGLAVWRLYPYIGDIVALRHYKGISYGWVAAALFVQLLQYIVDGYVLRELLGIFGFKLSIKNTVRISALDVFAIHFMPVGELGSLAAFIYFYRKLGVKTRVLIYLNYFFALFSVAVLAILLIGSAAVIHGEIFSPLFKIASLGLIAAVLLLSTVVVRFAADKNPAPRQTYAWLARYAWYGKFHNTLESMRDLTKIAAAKRMRFALLCAAKNANTYIIDIVILFCCAQALHAPVSPFVIAFACALSAIAGTISFVPAGLGASDAAMTIVYSSAGVAPTALVGIILLNRVASFLVPLPIGVLAYTSLRRELRLGTG